MEITYLPTYYYESRGHIVAVVPTLKQVQFSVINASRTSPMNSDQLSSPPPFELSLPLSAPSESVSLPRTQTLQRRTTDALTLDDVPSEAPGTVKAKRKKRPKIQNSDIPLVKDAVGESVADTFENFLRTCVICTDDMQYTLNDHVDSLRQLILRLHPVLMGCYKTSLWASTYTSIKSTRCGSTS